MLSPFSSKAGTLNDHMNVLHQTQQITDESLGCFCLFVF
jgi:hypothetical protein